MPLSRLDNFIKNVRGNILYVSPNDLDATDSIENQGNSMGRPFITIQRALIEAARFSYQKGLDNDRFGKTTIMLMPGDHLVDNRPGLIPTTTNTYLNRNGSTTNDFPAFNSSTNFDLNSVNNQLYKLNSVHGGVIVPRGTSIVGYDLRKTKIRPTYVPDPTNSDITSSALFRITGGCYFWQFTIFDADPNGFCYVDYTTNKTVPNFSHHKLTCFEYADGVNDVNINDAFMNYQAPRTDLDMYYEKVGLAYGPSSGRTIEPDFPSSAVDIQTKVDEYRIVGPKTGNVGITSIIAGNGNAATNIITAESADGVDGLDVDTAFTINNVSDAAYNGSFVVTEVLNTNAAGFTTAFKYQVANVPTDPAPSSTGVTLALDTDTVTSASPYIFNISLRSVFGVSGLHADGSKAAGFKSMVVAQFTGVSLQKDNNAFVRYNETSGLFEDSTTVSNLSSDANAKYKPAYYNYHIKASNDAICQLVSIFAIGYAQQFVTDSGGDFSVTNSNSNFGQFALNSSGYRDEAFSKDDVGYITHVIPPEEIQQETFNLEYEQIDVSKTVSAATTSRLYLYNKTNVETKPRSVIQGYRIGAKTDDELKITIVDNGTQTEYTAQIVMPNTSGTASEAISKKQSFVGRVGTANSISANTISFTSNHQFIDGETIRIVSDNAKLPDGLEANKVYFAIVTGVNADQIKVATSLNEALEGNDIDINSLGGNLVVESRVSDKIAGNAGHPIQYDYSQNNWYLNVSNANNSIYSKIVGIQTALGAATPRTYITRQADTRGLGDKIYKLRYVVPAGAGISSARPPRTSYIIEESNTVIGKTDAEVAAQFSPTTVTLNNLTELRNPRIVSSASYSGGLIVVNSETPHGLTKGSKVKLNNVVSTNNTVGAASSGFNYSFTVAATNSQTQFTLLADTITDPGTFSNNVSLRTVDLPTFQRVRAPNNYSIYDIDTIREYASGEQDGIYYLTLLDKTTIPSTAPFTDRDKFAYSQPVKELFPQYDRDNPNSDPNPAISNAKVDPLGQVDVDDVKNSITRTTVNNGLVDLTIGAGITDIVSNSAGTAHTIFTLTDHGLNRIVSVSIASSGTNYGNGTGSVENLYNAQLTNSATGVNATARITVDGVGGITDVEIMNPGSNYVVGQTLSVVGVATQAGFVAGTVNVTGIYDNTGDTLRVSGITSFRNAGYNQLYQITGISTSQELEVNSLTAVPTPSTSGIGVTVTATSFQFLTGRTLDVSSFQYNRVTGIATVVTVENHGYRTGNKVTLSGASNDLYNGDFIVTNNVGLTTFFVNVGVTTLNPAPAISGSQKAHNPGLISQAGTLSLYDENFGGRVLNAYAGITTTLQLEISNTTTDEVHIDNLSQFDFKIGDSIRINDEIMRIKTTVANNPVRVFRGLFGTQAASHAAGSVINRVNIEPIELRRPSIIRASGHTFEYLGFGPGNYSTAIPDRQANQPDTQAQLISQAQSASGGLIVYTGMNDRGDFYIGNKRISSSTGKEEVFETPIPTVTGEDVFALGNDVGLDVLAPVSVDVSRTLNIQGGQNNDLLSQFNGPTLFTQKLTNTSIDGIEANSLFLQGDVNVSRKITVGNTRPATAGNPGDIVFNANVASVSGIGGWVFTTDRTWNPLASVSINQYKKVLSLDQVGIGTTTPADFTVQVGSATSIVSIDGNGGVGIGTTNVQTAKLRVVGAVVATAFTGDGSGLTNLQNDSLWAGIGTIYPGTISNNVGIGTSVFDADYSLIIGAPGTGKTDLFVTNQSRFISTVAITSTTNITGKLTATNYDFSSSTGKVVAGVVTATNVNVGSGGTILTTTNVGVGIGTLSPRNELDIEGRTRFKSYYEISNTVSSVSNNVNLNLNNGQFFELTTAAENISQFTLQNPASGGTHSFTLKIVQGSTPRTVGIDTFKTSGGTDIPIYWNGGVVPTVTQIASAVDIYSFITFDGGSSLYGVIGGQNFS